MSKPSFRAKPLEPNKPMPIYMAEELPNLPDYSAINRAVPQMPSGMEKEEECEHHLQRAICAGLIIPTPEVSDIPQKEFFDRIYPANYVKPRQLIHMQPFTMEQDITDYDMDSEDECWLQSQTQKLDLSPLKFEEMMDRLEKSSSQKGLNVDEAKALLKEDDDLTIAVFDYWLNKRLKMQRPLILTVKTEHRIGPAPNNPYLAFRSRRRTEKMQTRKNRKNDEVSYEKMLKLKRDFCRAVTLLELIKRREKTKREHVHLTIEIFEKRFHAKDFSGAIFNEVSSIKTASSRPAFTPIFHNHYTNQSWTTKSILKDEGLPRKEKRQYKKRKHKSLGHSRTSGLGQDMGPLSSDEESNLPVASPEPEEMDEEGQFAFRRNHLCSYHMPLPQLGNWPWCSKEENGGADKNYRYNLASISVKSNRRRCIGFARRRLGRGGRVILDRASTASDDEFWRTLDFTILENDRHQQQGSSTLTDGAAGRDAWSTTPVATASNFVTRSSPGGWSNSVNAGLMSSLRGSGYEFGAFDGGEIKTEVKVEPMDYSEMGVSPLDASFTTGTTTCDVKEDEQQMLEYLQSIRRDWLHFRAKTPPPDEEPVCTLQPVEESFWKPGCDSPPFAMEIQTLDAPGAGALLDTSTFVTDPFTFDTLDFLDIPITDTRQQSSTDKIVQTTTGLNLNVNVGINTLTSSSVSNENNCLASSSVANHVDSPSNNSNTNKCDATNAVAVVDSDYNNSGGSDADYNEDDGIRTTSVGCSRFYVSDVAAGDSGATFSSKAAPFSTCTFASPKFNSINAVSEGQLRPNFVAPSSVAESSLNSTNGILPQYGYEKSTGRTRNNKLSYAYTGGMEFTNTNPGISLHTSAHTLTLNSHSANIFEIPISNNTDTVSTDLVNSSCTETSGTSANNKNKTIVRKNNLVMEVT